MRLNLLIIGVVALLIAGCSQEKAKTNPHVILETTKGAIEIEFYQQQSPVTVANFLTYTNEGYYDGTVFHRVMTGFIVK